MNEWMIEIDSADGVAADEEDLLSVAAALDEARGLTGAAMSLNVPTGRISASFSVSADDAADAAASGVELFLRALAGSGYAAQQPARVLVERLLVPA